MTKKPSMNDAPEIIRKFWWGYHIIKKVISGRNQKGYKILQMKDVAKEWDFIIKSVDKYLLSKDTAVEESLLPESYKNWAKNNLNKVAVHFYHRPRDTEEPFVIGNGKLIQRGFRILWVFNPAEAGNKFISNLSESMGPKTLERCEFLEMDETLNNIPVNFTVIAPYHKRLPLVYVRFEDLDFAIRIESRGPTVSLFDDLGCACIKKTTWLKSPEG